MSKFIDVFKLTGSAMQSRGNFFALMFLAMACGCLVIYCAIGWTSNVVAQVRHFLQTAETSSSADFRVPDPQS